MPPEIQKVLTDSLIIVIPAFAGWVVARLSKAKKDLDAAFQKLRVHEEQLGIETCVEKGQCRVSSRPGPSKITPSGSPQPISQENG